MTGKALLLLSHGGFAALRARSIASLLLDTSLLFPFTWTLMIAGLVLAYHLARRPISADDFKRFASKPSARALRQ